MIGMEEMRQLLCRTYTGLRARAVATADDWIGDGGEFIAHTWMSQLCILVQHRLMRGDYDQSAELFLLIERLLDEGDATVKTVVATGFLEGMQTQQRLDPASWRPLLGDLAKAHCAAMDTFYGIKTQDRFGSEAAVRNSPHQDGEHVLSRTDDMAKALLTDELQTFVAAHLPGHPDWLHRFRRLRIRHERRTDTHQAFLSLACSLICWRYMQRFC